jgi:hypothetical protein
MTGEPAGTQHSPPAADQQHAGPAAELARFVLIVAAKLIGDAIGALAG